MTLTSKQVRNAGQVKKDVKNFQKCPICGKVFEIGIEWETLEELNKDEYFPYPHVHLHGTPLHAMLCYIDKNLTIRNVGKIKSIEISRDSETLSEIMRKWSNPF